MGKTPRYQGIVQPTCSASLYEEVVTARPVLGNSTDLKGQFQGVFGEKCVFQPICLFTKYLLGRISFSEIIVQ